MLDNILNFLEKPLIKVIIIGITGIISVLWKEYIWIFIKDRSDILEYTLIILGATILVLLFTTIKINAKKNIEKLEISEITEKLERLQKQEELEYFKSKPESDYSRYSIILIDDDHKIRTKYTSLFSRIYNISIINRIDSVLYLYGFDIIIFDVVNTVTFNKDSCLDIIKILKEKQPYKYIIAISTEYDKLKECESLVNATICKSDKSFEDRLKEEIDKAFTTLDNPSKHWEEISKGQYCYKEKEVYYKRNYINTLKNYSHFNNKK